MNKKWIICFFLLTFLQGLEAQQFDQISIGPEYVDQTYYSIKQGTIQSNDYRVWDIAFSTQGLQDGGVFINEASHLSADSQIELYHVPNGDYNETITVDTASWVRLFNPDQNWQTGAFNTIALENNPLDYGWGTYDPTSMVVSGTEVFVIKLRNEQYKKIFIQSLTQDYKFKYADLDGSNERLNTISKADHLGKVMARFSLENDVVADIEPDSWDLLFTRYMDYVSDGAGTYLDYVITGVFSDNDVLVAQADGVDPEQAMEEDYLGLYTSQVDEIGYDWKNFDINILQWSVADDRVYFVKNADNDICKIAFIDFEGSTTGVTTITKECNIVADVSDPVLHGLNSVNAFPNPASMFVDLALDFEVKTEALVTLIDATGKTHVSLAYTFNAGFQSTRIDLNVPAGNYYVLIQTKNQVQRIPLIIIK